MAAASPFRAALWGKTSNSPRRRSARAICGFGGSIEREARQLEAQTETSECRSDGNAANENVFVVVAALVVRAGDDASGFGVAWRPQSHKGENRVR